MRIQHYLPLAVCTVLLTTHSDAQTRPGRTNRTDQDDLSTRIIRNFNFKAEASKVLAALARIAGVGIVTTDDLKVIVNANLNNISIEDAVKLVAAQAKVAYRHVGNVFVVAPDKDMPDILAKYGTEERVPLQNVLDPVKIKDVADQIRGAVPFLTVRPAGHTLILIGAPEDLDRAKSILQELDAPYTGEPTDSVSLTLNTLPVADVQQILQTQFKLDAQKAGESAVVFTGKHSEVLRAQTFIRELDRGKEANARYVVYQVKYASPLSLVTTLRQSVQNLTVVNGPASYYIPLPQINFSTSTSLGGGSGGGSGSGTGGGTGGGLGSGGTGSTGGSGLGGTGSGGGSGSGSGGNNSGGIGSSLNTGSTGERTRSLILGGTEETIKIALKLLSELDTPTPQIVLDVKVVSANPTTTQILGIDWTNNGGASIQFKSQAGGNFVTLPTTSTPTLNAFFARDDVRILAKPTITALDNHEGVVFVGETRRVSVSTIPTGLGTGGNIVLNSVVEIPVGIILQMRPRVNEDDKITLHVHPIYSTAGQVDAATGLFTTSQREADTTVRIRSGETLVIGGLLQEEDTNTLTKIPILGDIPLIGHLFRNTTKTHLRREVLVFVTPHLLKE